MTFPQYIVRGSIATVDIRNVAKQHIDRMNKFAGVEGFFYNNYSQQAGKMYLTDLNAKKLDECRKYVDDVPVEVRDYLVYCLMEAMSRVTNTAGHHSAFLKDWQDSAVNPLELRQEPIYGGTVRAYCGDILDLLRDGQFRQESHEDILYLDPPYNHRQYAPNYHLYETLVRYDDPKLNGKTGLREYSEQKSEFCTKDAIRFTRKVLESTTASLILISYSSDGRMSLQEMEEMLCGFAPSGELSVHIKEQKRYKADNDGNRNINNSSLREYLFEIVRPQSIM